MDDSRLKGSDGSQYHCQYAITSDYKLIGMNEYGVRLANNNESTHVLILDECEASSMTDKNSHELLLDVRPGQARVTYCRESDIEKLSTFINTCRDDPTRNYIQVPYHLSRLELNVASWVSVKEPVQAMLKLRNEEELKALAKKELGPTLEVNIWGRRP